jgi:hypothetical protein
MQVGIVDLNRDEVNPCLHSLRPPFGWKEVVPVSHEAMTIKRTKRKDTHA